MKKLAVVAVVCALSSLAFAAESLKIDFRYNTRADDGKTYLHWQTKGTKVKDSFDALSGASVAKSTKLLRELQAVNKNKQLPKGLYALLLFAVSPSAQAQTDLLAVEADGERIAISFMHRGNAYRITTDEKGYLNTRTSFAIAEGLAANTAGVFTITEPFANENDATVIDWSNVSFAADNYDESAPTIWDGKLKATFADGVLKIRGRLKKITPPEKITNAESD